jgi:hypothetical protein
VIERLLRPATGKSRLYGWLMSAYENGGNSLPGRHLPHRDSHQLADAARRPGWTSCEDCDTVSVQMVPKETRASASYLVQVALRRLRPRLGPPSAARAGCYHGMEYRGMLEE